MQRHGFDTVSFVFGVLFFGLGLTTLFADEDISVLQARWIWPALLLVAGLGILGLTLRKEPIADALEPRPDDTLV